MRITLEEKFKDVLNQKGEKSIPKNMGMPVANTNINISSNSKPQLHENQNIPLKPQGLKAFI